MYALMFVEGQSTMAMSDLSALINCANLIASKPFRVTFLSSTALSISWGLMIMIL